MTDSGRWHMWAHRYDNGDLHNLGERWWVEIHGLPDPIVAVDVAEVADGDPAATHWGWVDTGDATPEMIYPRESLFSMCFPYGVQAEVDAGKGRVVRLAVAEVTENNNA